VALPEDPYNMYLIKDERELWLEDKMRKGELRHFTPLHPK